MLLFAEMAMTLSFPSSPLEISLQDDLAGGVGSVDLGIGDIDGGGIGHKRVSSADGRRVGSSDGLEGEGDIGNRDAGHGGGIGRRQGGGDDGDFSDVYSRFDPASGQVRDHPILENLSFLSAIAVVY